MMLLGLFSIQPAFAFEKRRKTIYNSFARQTHTSTYIYIYIYASLSVSVRAILLFLSLMVMLLHVVLAGRLVFLLVSANGEPSHSRRMHA